MNNLADEKALRLTSLGSDRLLRNSKQEVPAQAKLQEKKMDET